MQVIPGSKVVQAEDVEKLIISYERNIKGNRHQSSISEYACTIILKDGRKITKIQLSSFDTCRLFKDISDRNIFCSEESYVLRLKEDLKHIYEMNPSSIKSRISGDILTTIFNAPTCNNKPAEKCIVS